MSILGTGVAAGVAQTTLQSQQVAQKRDKRTKDVARQRQRVEEVMEIQLKGLEEDDAAEQQTQLHVDNQVTEQSQHPPIENGKQRKAKHLSEQEGDDAEPGHVDITV